MRQREGEQEGRGLWEKKRMGVRARESMRAGEHTTKIKIFRQSSKVEFIYKIFKIIIIRRCLAVIV